MIQNKWALSVVLAMSSALILTVGCGGDDDEEEAGFDCAALCAESDDCADGGEADCMTECDELSEMCPDEAEAYLECAEGGEISCLDQTSIGVVLACVAELTAVQQCAIPGGGGAGGVGGAGD